MNSGILFFLGGGCCLLPRYKVLDPENEYNFKRKASAGGLYLQLPLVKAMAKGGNCRIPTAKHFVASMFSLNANEIRNAMNDSAQMESSFQGSRNSRYKAFLRLQGSIVLYN